MSFTGVVNLTDLNPPNGYRIAGEGKGGLAGSAPVAQLAAGKLPEGTRVTYDVDAQVTGKIASLGARFIEPTSARSPVNFLRNSRRWQPRWNRRRRSPRNRSKNR